MRDRRQMEDRIIFDRGVEAGVIAEGSFRPHLPGCTNPSSTKSTSAGTSTIDRLALHQLDRFLADETGEQNFVEPIG